MSDATDLARQVLETEANAILGLISQIDGNFDRALDLLHECTGRVVVSGMGKSGIISRKIAATLSSTGTPAIFLSPAEAIHGDLGMVQSGDVVLALSDSGETKELLRLLEAIRRIGARLIALTGTPKSTLGEAADVTLSCHVAEEACPMNLAPTASTTAALALGDALAMALSRRKGFQEEQFASLHPGGQLGKRLMRVKALMHEGAAIPKVTKDALVPAIVSEINAKKLGMTCVIDATERLIGIVTDGDLRRHLVSGTNLLERRASDVMTPHPITVAPDTLAAEALRVLEQKKITSLVVVDERMAVHGVVHLHDLWRTQMI